MEKAYGRLSNYNLPASFIVPTIHAVSHSKTSLLVSVPDCDVIASRYVAKCLACLKFCNRIDSYKVYLLVSNGQK